MDVVRESLLRVTSQVSGTWEPLTGDMSSKVWEVLRLGVATDSKVKETENI